MSHPETPVYPRSHPESSQTRYHQEQWCSAAALVHKKERIVHRGTRDGFRSESVGVLLTSAAAKVHKTDYLPTWSKALDAA